jgi:hypothetical protein
MWQHTLDPVQILCTNPVLVCVYLYEYVVIFLKKTKFSQIFVSLPAIARQQEPLPIRETVPE